MPQETDKSNRLHKVKEAANETLEDLKSKPKEKKVEAIPQGILKKAARKRAQKQPILQKIVKAIKREDNTFRELIINSEPLEKRVALLEDGVLEKFEIERVGENRMVGAIFKGKIQNLEPGLKAAFVDIGQEKNAFLHYWDIIPTNNDSAVEIVRQNQTEEQKRRQDKTSLKDIPKIYPIGTNIVVQITKAQIGSKGPRTTTNLAIPGRYMVLMPYSGQCGISRKIEDQRERNRLKKILGKLTIPEGMGVIVRTAGEGKQLRFFIRDLHILLKKWEKIQENIDSDEPCGLVYQEPDLVERTVRDFLTEEIDRVLIDTEDDYERMCNIISEISPRSRSKIHLFKESIPIFERFNIERQIEQTFMRNVPLPSGGEIVIEETEALTAIDVNTGSHRGSSKDGKDYILQANLEAAREAARQIRLRNVGGLIIIDFIDMKNKRDRNAVLNCMREEMSADKAKSHVLPISQLGIMQMTRQRHQESTARGIYECCPYCTGRGAVKSPRSMSVEIQRKINSVVRYLRKRQGDNEVIAMRVFLNPSVLERLRNEDENLLLDLEQVFNIKLSFRADPAFHVENFKVLNALTGEEMN